MLAQQGLLIAVIAAHQQAYFIVMVQTRQRQLVPEPVLRRNIIELTGQLTQRTDDQTVDTPCDRHRQNKHQQEVSGH